MEENANKATQKAIIGLVLLGALAAPLIIIGGRQAQIELSKPSVFEQRIAKQKAEMRRRNQGHSGLGRSSSASDYSATMLNIMLPIAAFLLVVGVIIAWRLGSFGLVGTGVTVAVQQVGVGPAFIAIGVVALFVGINWSAYLHSDIEAARKRDKKEVASRQSVVRRPAGWMGSPSSMTVTTTYSGPYADAEVRAAFARRSAQTPYSYSTAAAGGLFTLLGAYLLWKKLSLKRKEHPEAEAVAGA